MKGVSATLQVEGNVQPDGGATDGAAASEGVEPEGEDAEMAEAPGMADLFGSDEDE